MLYHAPVCPAARPGLVPGHLKLGALQLRYRAICPWYSPGPCVCGGPVDRRPLLLWDGILVLAGTSTCLSPCRPGWYSPRPRLTRGRQIVTCSVSTSNCLFLPQFCPARSCRAGICQAHPPESCSDGKDNVLQRRSSILPRTAPRPASAPDSPRILGTDTQHWYVLLGDWARWRTAILLAPRIARPLTWQAGSQGVKDEAQPMMHPRMARSEPTP